MRIARIMDDSRSVPLQSTNVLSRWLARAKLARFPNMGVGCVREYSCLALFEVEVLAIIATIAAAAAEVARASLVG